MQTALTLETFAGLVLSIILGAAVGMERKRTHKPAGLRTHMLVSLDSCVFTIVSAWVWSAIKTNLHWVAEQSLFIEKTGIRTLL